MKMLTPPLSAYRRFLIIIGAIAAPIFFFRIGGSLNTLISHLIYLVVFPIALFGFWTTIKDIGRGSPQHKALLVVFFGIILSMTGQFLTDLSFFFSLSGPIISLASFFFLTAYILVALGYVMEAMVLKINWRNYPWILVGFIIVCLAISYILYYYQLSPAFISQGYTPVLIGYVIGDIALIASSLLVLQIAISYRGGLLSSAWTLIFLGHFIILIGDVFYAIFNQPYSNNVWPYTLINLVWLIANLLIASGFAGIGDSIRFAQKQIAEHKPKSQI